jgi:hypothetical protein
LSSPRQHAEKPSDVSILFPAKTIKVQTDYRGTPRYPIAGS